MAYRLGDPVKGVVVRVERFGVFLELDDGTEGFIDAAGMSETWEPLPEEESRPQIGDVLTGRVVLVDERQTRLSIRPSDLRALEGQ